MLQPLPPLEVPDIAAPELGSPNYIVDFTDYILGQLIQASAEVVVVDASGDRSHPDVEWRLRHALEADGETVVIGSCPRRLFRHILARIGHHYMGGQLYCGFAVRTLIIKGTAFTAYFYLGNCGLTGYWTKIAAGPERPSANA
jgi:hypothetical protein